MFIVCNYWKFKCCRELCISVPGSWDNFAKTVSSLRWHKWLETVLHQCCQPKFRMLMQFPQVPAACPPQYWLHSPHRTSRRTWGAASHRTWTCCECRPHKSWCSASSRSRRPTPRSQILQHSSTLQFKESVETICGPQSEGATSSNKTKRNETTAWLHSPCEVLGPYFICQLYFVTSRHYCAARVDGRVTGLR
jgi:hypothetical protein